MSRILSFLFLLLSLPLLSLGQSAQCPDVEIGGAPQITFPCANGTVCTTLVATYPDIRQTFDGANAYLAGSVPYSGHQPFAVPGATPILVNQDDVYSGVINLPFTFCFYGGQYNKVVVGANGTISFDISYAGDPSGYDMCTGGLFTPNTPVTIPSTDDPYPRNAIFACFHDIDPTVPATDKGIEYALIGEAPCRKLVVNWRNIPHFSCTNITSTFQCVIYENTNVIEVYVEKKPVCSNWNCGVAVIGVQNNARNQAVAAPGRNAAVWTTTTSNSEAWRFIPNGTPLLNSVQLLNASQNVIATGTSSLFAPGVLTTSFNNVCVSGASEKYYIKASYTACSGSTLTNTDSIQLVKISPPAAPTVASPVVYCQSDAATPLTAGGTGLLWYTTPAGGTGNTTAPTPSTAIAGTTTWYVSQTIAGCEGSRAAVEVVVKPKSATSESAQICPGGSYQFGTQTLTTAGTYTGTFTGSNGCDSTVTLILTVGSSIQVSIPVTLCQGQSYAFNGSNYTTSGSYSVTHTSSAGCDSVTTLVLTVNPLPAAPGVSNPVTYCQNATAIPLTATGNNLLWYTTPTGGTGTAAAPTPSTTTPGTATWYVSQTNNGCEGPRAAIDVVVNANPAVPGVTTPVTYCQNAAAVSLTATGSNLLWYTTLTGGTGSATAPTPSTATAGNLTWFVSQTVNGCESSRAAIDVIIYATPAPPIVTSPVTYCQNSVAVPLTANGNNLRWYTTATGGAGTTTAPTPSTAIPGTTTWYVSQTNNGCEGPRAAISVIINPTITQAVTAQICQGGSYQFGTQTLTTAGTYTGSFASANGCDSVVTLTLTIGTAVEVAIVAAICQGQSYTFNGNTYTTSGSYNYTSTSSTGCDSITTLNLTVNPLPAAPGTITPVAYCQNAPAVPLTATGSGLLWYTTPTGGTGNQTPPLPSTVIPGTTTWYVSQTINGCEGPRTTINVVVNPTPTAPGVTTPVVYCKNAAAVQLTATGNNLLWYTTATGGTGTATAPTPSTATPGTTTWYVSQTVNNCESQRAALDVNVIPLPAAPTVTTPVTYCQNATATPLSATGSNLLWYTAPTGGIGATTAPTPSTTTPGAITWYVSQTVNGCEGPRAALTVTVNPLPVAPAVTTPVTYCQNATTTPLTATGSNLLWYTTATGGTGTATAPVPSTVTPGTTTWYVSQTVSGCEGPRASISVIVKPITASSATAQICPGSSYPFGTQTITTAGTYTETFTSANGCDSTVTLTVTMNSVIQVNASATICQGQNYTFNGTAYNAAGSYSDTFNSVNGCDSIATLTLNVNPLPAAPAVTTPVTYCQNATAAPLTATGSNLLWYTTATGGTGTSTAPTPSTTVPGSTTWYVSQITNGCEGPRAALMVTVNPLPAAPTVTTPVTYCQNATASPLIATGSNLLWYTTATGGTGTATAPTPSTVTPGNITWYVSQTVNGCEGSRASVNVIINPTPAAPAVTTPVTYCQNATVTPLTATGSSLLWYTTATGGTGTATAPTPSTATPGTTTWYVSQTVSGCESPRAAINAIVNPAITSSATAQICPGGSYQFGSQTITTAGTYTETFTAANGCDSTVTLTMTMNSIIQVNSSATICQGQSYTFNGTAYDTAGIYSDTFTTTGCDSVTTLTLTITPLPAAPSVTTPVTYCQDATATPLTATGSNLLWYTTATGGTGTATAPTPGTTTPGTTTWYVSQTVTGCEGTRASISVVIKPKTSSTTTAQICPGGSYIFGTQTITTAGTYTETFTAANGCDSTVTLTMTINSIIQVNTSATICQGQNYTFNGTVYNTAGTYSDTFATAGCDSVTTLTLTVNPLPAAPGVTTPVAYCQNAATVPLTATGNNLLWYTTATGGTGTATAPTPSTATPGNTTWYVSQTTNGCEGPRAALTVTVNPLPAVPVVSTPVTYCQNTTAVPLTATGSNLLWYTTATGGTGTATAPTPSTATSGSTTWYVSQTVSGCEGPRASINVVINPTPAAPTVTTPVTYCQNAAAAALTATGSNLLWYTTATGGTGTATAPTPATATPGTTTWYVSQTGNGCEGPRAAIAVTIYATPAAPAVISPLTYCQNTTATPLTATGSNLLWYTTATGGTGTATAPIPSTATPGNTTWYVSQTTNGCEGPRAALTVTVNPLPAVPVVSTPVTYCQNTTAVPLTATGSNLLWYTTATGGTGTATAPTPSTATSGSTTWYVSQTVSGCEGPRASINVVINPTPAAPTVTTPVTYCQNAAAAALTATGSNLLWYTTATGGTGTATAPTPATATPGTTTWYVSQTTNGCEGPRAAIAVTVYPTPPAPAAQSPVNYCQGDEADPLTAKGAVLRWYTTAAGGTGTATAPTPSTASVDTLTWYVSQLVNGCEGPRVPLVVIINPYPTVDARLDIVGSVIFLDAQATGTGLDYAWTPPDGLNCTDCPRPEADPKESTVYTIKVTNAAGCSVSDTIGVYLTCARVFFPNTFTPNGDGNNDRFYPMGQSIAQVKTFRIYDRWGGLVYSRDNIPANDPSYGWDGAVQNKAVKPDVFVYYMEGICKTGESIFLKGDVTIVR